MSGPDSEIVERYLHDLYERKAYGSVLGLLADEFIGQDASGRVYAGALGFTQWLERVLELYERQSFELEQIESLHDGYVLLVGAIHRRSVRSGDERLPGAWICFVSGDRLSAIIYFRTEEQARAAVPPLRSEDSPTAVVGRFLDALGRSDYVEVVAVVAQDYSFSSWASDPGGRRRGIAAFVAFLSEVLEAHPAYGLESYELIAVNAEWVISDAVLRFGREGAVERRRGAWLSRVVDGRLSESYELDSVAGAQAEHRRRTGSDSG